MRNVRATVTAVAVAVLAATCAAQLPASGASIKAHQHFVGRVNGQPSVATVHTVCAGPATAGRVGSIASGQTVSVRHVSTGKGYTGYFSTIYAWFVQNASENGHKAATITAYRTKVAIPTSVRVPCEGTGRMEFSSCPYLAPCAYGWVPTYVKVQYVNIAA